MLQLRSLLLARGPTLGQSFHTAPGLAQYFKERESEKVANKVHFKRIVLFNKRHHPHQKRDIFPPFEARRKAMDHAKRYSYGARGTGVRHHANWEHVPEKVPQLIVPDLTDCELKPYVSYRTKEIYQEEFTAKDLFNAVYGKKILSDFKAGQLNDQGEPLQPSQEEKMTAEDARVQARQTGSDIFLGGTPRSKKWNIRWEY
eukprot:snap_masked-scaffold521_size146803-processed-gene-0.1 protein:Tk12188 transcript:snap_masked-scaffold521_size146803-processed-gene-0.1-mRNA-1 annotation:"39s ribosomal protein mitochondrial precursor"